ncbi:hypothetical protein J3458_019541 [Metarhizium acridum]|uniref:uncharacterized protein n=1 Tax=Metarhizium acridum TaxID=92637 RepID=UPI001C6AC771|nr:hypothetical protein J3458_019541 [Metarhizium acridum]
MGRHILIQVALALTAVRALSIPNRPSTEPMTLPMNFQRSEPIGGCLLKRSEHTEHEHKKRGIQDSCRQFQQKVDEAFKKCSERAGNALSALNGTDFPAKDTSGNAKRAGQGVGQPKEDGKETLPKLLQDWFNTGTNDQQALAKIRRDFTNIKAECDKKDKSRVAVKCEQCQQGIAGQTYQGTGPITLCMVALTDDRNSTNIRSQDLGDVLLHEMSHVVGYTDDRGYGVEKFLPSLLWHPPWAMRLLHAVREVSFQALQEVSLQVPQAVSFQALQEVPLQDFQEVSFQGLREVSSQGLREVRSQGPQEVPLQDFQEVSLQVPQAVRFQVPQAVRFQAPRKDYFLALKEVR